MEFKYRAVDEQPPPPPQRQHPPPFRHQTTPSSNYSYFTEQAIRAGYRSPGFRQANVYFSVGSGRANEYCGNTNDARETIERELEKEKIREEIIAAERTRRLILEAEVRREMMIEREMAMRSRGGGGVFDRLSYWMGGGVGFEPREVPFQQAMGWPLEDRIALSIEERLGLGARREIRGLETVPFRRGNMEPKIKEVTALTLDVGKQKDKIVLLAKPEVHLSGAKRKVASPKEESANVLVEEANIAKKKVKEEWSCALCQVSATSERGLNDHIQGKKHKSKEAALRAQRNGQNIGIGVFPKKAVKPTVEVANNLNSQQGVKSGGKLWEFNRTGESSLPDNSSIESSKQGNISILQETDKTDNLKNKNLRVRKAPKKGKNKKKRFTFWCEMCQVGAHNVNVMEAHRKGKKHRSQLQEASKNGKSIPTPQLAGIQVLNDSDEANKQGDDENENVEKVDGSVNEQDKDYEAATGDADGLDC